MHFSLVVKILQFQAQRSTTQLILHLNFIMVWQLTGKGQDLKVEGRGSRNERDRLVRHILRPEQGLLDLGKGHVLPKLIDALHTRGIGVHLQYFIPLLIASWRMTQGQGFYGGALELELSRVGMRGERGEAKMGKECGRFFFYIDTLNVIVSIISMLT